MSEINKSIARSQPTGWFGRKVAAETMQLALIWRSQGKMHYKPLGSLKIKTNKQISYCAKEEFIRKPASWGYLHTWLACGHRFHPSYARSGCFGCHCLCRQRGRLWLLQGGHAEDGSGYIRTTSLFSLEIMVNREIILLYGLNSGQ